MNEDTRTENQSFKSAGDTATPSSLLKHILRSEPWNHGSGSDLDHEQVKPPSTDRETEPRRDTDVGQGHPAGVGWRWNPALPYSPSSSEMLSENLALLTHLKAHNTCTPRSSHRLQFRSSQRSPKHVSPAGLGAEWGQERSPASFYPQTSHRTPSR